MRFLFESNPERQSAGLAVLRIITGVVLLVHGWQKVFTMGFPGVTVGFAHMGIPMPGVTAPLVSLLELLGGLALIIGLLTRVAALGLIVVMMGAITFVHFKNGFFGPMGYEYPLLLLTVGVTILIAGPGRYSIDRNLSARNVAAHDR